LITEYILPNVVGAIPNGRTQISGNFSQEEAKELVDVLGAGKLPAGAKVVQATVVGPSLGQESIDAGLMSFMIAFAIIIVYHFLLRWSRCLCSNCNGHQLILYFRNYGFGRLYAYASWYRGYRINDGSGGRYERYHL
jgi:hypothetical protein